MIQSAVLLLVYASVTEFFLIDAKSVTSNLPKQSWPRPLHKSTSYGGSGGSKFDDLLQFHNLSGVRSIVISYGDEIDSIQVTYSVSNKSLQTPKRGEDSKNLFNVSLDLDEQVIEVKGTTDGQLINQLTIVTMGSKFVHKVYGPFGRKMGSEPFSFKGQIIAFHGRSGDMLDNIGVYSLQSLKKSEQYGDGIGTDFDDYYDLKYPPIVKIQGINIWCNQYFVDGLQVEYLLLDNNTISGDKHGFRYNTNVTKITFATDERLVAVQGKHEMNLQTAERYLAQLTFLTVKDSGEKRQYGPFGLWGRDPFEVSGNILSFHGGSGALIYRIGAYYI